MKRLRVLFILGMLLMFARWSRAGFDHKGGFAGTGYPVGSVAMNPPQDANASNLIAKVKAQYMITDGTELQATLNLQKNVCNAIDLAKKQNEAVGKCLEDLKKKGRICVAFDTHDCYGVCRHDLSPACNENDLININGTMMSTNCLPPYDPSFYWIATTLLHEGRHAIQDFAGAANSNACRQLALEQIKRPCNEVEAHTLENQWITELTNALAKLKNMEALPAGVSAATTEIYNSLTNLMGAARSNAIVSLEAALASNQSGNLNAIECYTKGKQALEDYINSDLDNPTNKAVAHTNLTKALSNAAWSSTISRYDLPKAMFSSAASGILQQFNGPGSSVPLPTGLSNIMDFLVFSNDTRLVVSGFASNGQARVLVYVDANSNGVFQASERIRTISLPPNFRLNLGLARHPSSGVVYLYEKSGEQLWAMSKNNSDGLPNGPGVMAFQGGPLQEEVLRWKFNADGSMLTGYPFIDSAAPALNPNELVNLLVDFDANGTFDTSVNVPFDQTIDYGPTWMRDAVVGDGALLVHGPPGRATVLLLLDPLFNPVATLGQVFNASPQGTLMTLSSPLQAGSLLMLLDLQTQAKSFVFSPDAEELHPPRLLEISQQFTLTRLKWAARPLRSYQVEYKDDLALPGWFPLPTIVTSPGFEVESFFTLPPPPLPLHHRFFRVGQLPPIILP